jgi:hypothetical protein
MGGKWKPKKHGIYNFQPLPHGISFVLWTLLILYCVYEQDVAAVQKWLGE